MPLYEYRCRTCDTTFEARRTMAEADEPSTCPQGHVEVKRLLSVFAAGRASASAPTASSGGACCGGGCGCR